MRPPGRGEPVPVGIVAVNTAAFALALAAWVVFGPTARMIAHELQLSPGSAAVLKATPILVGSLARVPIGLLTDRFGAKLMFPLLLALAALAALGTSFGETFAQVVGGGAVLGLVGATFAVGLQSVSSWTPPTRQGTALGVFGAGNAGLAITTFGLPWLLAFADWRGAFRVYAAGLALAAVAYGALVRDAPGFRGKTAWRELLAPLLQARTWRFGLYYTACFGVLLGVTLVLSDLYVDAYGIDGKTAGILVTTFTLGASLMRIPGGRLADGMGARRVVRWSLLGGGAALVPVSFGPPVAVTVAAMFTSGLALGIAMGATMKYISQYFPASVGAVGGIVGALGGVGGFLLPLAANAATTASGDPFAGAIPMLVVIGAALAVQQAAHGNAYVPRVAAAAPLKD